MYAQVSGFFYFLKHHPFPILKRTSLDLLASVFDFVTHAAMLIWKQMMLLYIRSEFIAEGYEILIVL